MIRKTCYILLILVSASYLTTAGDKDIKFTGYGATGLKVYKIRFSQETYYEGKLQAEIDFKKGIEAQLDLRGNSTDNSVNFREFSIRFKLYDKMKLKIGNIKKPFGYEYLFNRDELYSIDRSLTTENIAILGYGGRSISIMAYYKHKKKDAGFPVSYYLSVFKNNSLSDGLVARGEYHYQSFTFAFNYLMQSRGGWVDDRFGGIALDIAFAKNKYFGNINLFYVQDPDASHQHRTQYNQKYTTITAGGASLIAAKNFKIDRQVVHSIEPVLVLNGYVPDSEKTDRHVIQAVIGFNMYITKDVRLRINGDLRMTKNEFSDYSDNESGYIVELQARF